MYVCPNVYACDEDEGDDTNVDSGYDVEEDDADDDSGDEDEGDVADDDSEEEIDWMDPELSTVEDVVTRLAKQMLEGIGHGRFTQEGADCMLTMMHDTVLLLAHPSLRQAIPHDWRTLKGIAEMKEPAHWYEHFCPGTVKDKDHYLFNADNKSDEYCPKCKKIRDSNQESLSVPHGLLCITGSTIGQGPCTAFQKWLLCCEGGGDAFPTRVDSTPTVTMARFCLHCLIWMPTWTRTTTFSRWYRVSTQLWCKFRARTASARWSAT